MAKFDVQRGLRRGAYALTLNAIVFAVLGAVSAKNSRQVRMPVSHFTAAWVPMLLVPVAFVAVLSIVGSTPLHRLIRFAAAVFGVVISMVGLGLSFDTGDGVCPRLFTSLTGTPWGSCFSRPGFAAAFFWALGATTLSLLAPADNEPSSDDD